ncbi:hypothetical protein CRUP_001747 [Coryphaenoides rupestris]|nr:hypothetical protein CRUP_001747 [Coryphaenoides rupestris]
MGTGSTRAQGSLRPPALTATTRTSRRSPVVRSLTQRRLAAYSTVYPSRPESPMVSGGLHLTVRVVLFTSSTTRLSGALPLQLKPLRLKSLPRPRQPPPPAGNSPYTSASCSAPLSLVVEDVNNTTLTVKWRPPETIGDSGLDGYTVEYCKEGGSDWVVANSELTAANRLCVKDLTTGERLDVRVVAVNAGGRSEPCALVEPVPIREVVGEF